MAGRRKDTGKPRPARGKEAAVPDGNRNPYLPPRPISLRTLGDYLDLSPATISLVLNNAPGVRSIPQETRDRVIAAAKKFEYRPSFFARSLRRRQSFSVGVLVPELSDGYSVLVMSGIEEVLIEEGYFYLTASHRRKADLIEEYPGLLMDRTFSSDSDDRWESLMEVADELGIEVNPGLVVQLQQNLSSPELGYPVPAKLLESKQPFTALVSYNDIAAIGAIRSFRDLGLRVPEDISVVGFDDIQGAAYHTPALTTIRQPLNSMGSTAAKILLDRIRSGKEYPDEVPIVPELIIRESTMPPNPNRVRRK
jgi:LacI family transcriptional regulator